MDAFFAALGMNWALRQTIKAAGYGVGGDTKIEWSDSKEDWVSINDEGEEIVVTCSRDTGPDPIEVDSGWGTTKVQSEGCCGGKGYLCQVDSGDDYEEYEMRRYIASDGKMKVRNTVKHRRRSVAATQTYEKKR